MGFNATWSMAVGGMVGGGIFSVLGVVVNTAGQWAWLSFILAGLIALIAAYSYCRLTLLYQKGGGAFVFLNEINHKGMATSLAWLLVLGYTLTISVYAYTFGHYVAHVFNWGGWLPKILAAAVIAALALVNLKGVGDASRLEIITVWGKLLVLVGLALLGLVHWSPAQLTAGVDVRSWPTALVGAATIFMAYEGFQLLTYDYNDIQNPQTTLFKATLSAVVAVIAVYVVVTLGATMLVGAGTLVAKKEIALAIAGQQAMGTMGLVVVVIAAAFSTSSAINATLFSTARFIKSLAAQEALPAVLRKENEAHVPYLAVLGIAALAVLLEAVGSLTSLVDVASLIFLFMFGTVSFLAFLQRVKFRLLCLLGAIGCLLAIVLSVYKQWQEHPTALLIMMAFVVVLFVVRPLLTSQKKEVKEDSRS